MVKAAGIQQRDCRMYRKRQKIEESNRQEKSSSG